MRIQGPAVSATTTRAPHAIGRAACLTAGLVSMSIALQADAAIVTINLATAGSPTRDITAVNAGMTAYGLPAITVSDFVPGGTLSLYRRSGQIGLDPAGSMEIAFTLGSYTSPVRYVSGATIGGSASYSGSNSRTLFYWEDPDSSTPYNAPNFGAGSFIGFRFGSSGNYNYGYIEVLWTWTGNRSTSSFQLLSAAYESTANTAILAGATPDPVPAPSALALLALGGGACRRARRRTA